MIAEHQLSKVLSMYPHLVTVTNDNKSLYIVLIKYLRAVLTFIVIN